MKHKQKRKEKKRRKQEVTETRELRFDGPTLLDDLSGLREPDYSYVSSRLKRAVLSHFVLPGNYDPLSDFNRFFGITIYPDAPTKGKWIDTIS
jgi:hypothetical protein